MQMKYHNFEVTNNMKSYKYVLIILSIIVYE
jgi:hypothetical protein